MRSENGVLVDLGDVTTVIDNADVFAVGFHLFPERLLVDTRYDKEEGPFVSVVPQVSSLQERYFWLGQKRPRFGMPENFAFFFWPHSVSFLEETGLAQRIRERCVDSGWPDAAPQFDAALARLHKREEEITQAAIRGRDYRTLWPRKS